MATHKSALKRHRQSVKNNEKNRAIKAKIKTLTKKMQGAAKEEAPALLKEVQRKIAKAARKGIMHKKAAGKRVSHLMKAAANV